jgi:colanic acid/amylovoran biosynthesis glycosyltransferase
MGCRKKRMKAVYPAIRESLIEEAAKVGKACKKDEKKYILTVGRFHKVKGYDYLLDAVALCKERKVLHFILVGDYERKPDDYYRWIKSRIQNEGLESNITIYGKTKRDAELAELYRKAWCCLHTSVWESSPITVCEALLFGKPVIATDVGGTSEYLTDGENSILIPAKNGKAIEMAIEHLLDNQKAYETMSDNALESSEKYRNRTWNDVGNEYAAALWQFID